MNEPRIYPSREEKALVEDAKRYRAIQPALEKVLRVHARTYGESTELRAALAELVVKVHGRG